VIEDEHLGRVTVDELDSVGQVALKDQDVVDQTIVM